MAKRIKLPQGVTSVLVQNTIGLRNLVVDVSEERVVDTTETTLLAGSVDPGSVGENGINRDTDKFSTNLAELFSLLAESNNFGGADESEVTNAIDYNFFFFLGDLSHQTALLTEDRSRERGTCLIKRYKLIKLL